MITRIILVLAMWTMFVGTCAAGPGGGVRPAPPGPIDLLRMGVWGDYSGLCPKHYQFCRAGRRSLCCPASRGCCGDETGPYCCGSATSDDRSLYEDDLRTREYTCAARDITCSHGGRTICCYSNDRCCADDSGPYCCADRERGQQRYETHERYETRRYYDDNDNDH